jgi:hypothetical protein
MIVLSWMTFNFEHIGVSQDSLLQANISPQGVKLVKVKADLDGLSSKNGPQTRDRGKVQPTLALRAVAFRDTYEVPEMA